MLRGIWSAAALAAGVVLGGSAVAGDDAVKLGRFQPTAGGFGGAVRSAADVEAAEDGGDDTELVHGRRYRYGYGWPGYYRPYSSFSIGFSTGYWPRYYGGYGYGWGYPRYGWGGYGFGLGYPRYGWGGYGIGWGYPRYGYGWGGYGYGLGYSSFYRSGLAISVYSAPRIYVPSYAYSYASYYPYDWCHVGGIAAAVTTPATVLGNSVTSQSIPAPMPSTSNGTAQQLPPPTPLGQRVPDATAPSNGTYRYDGGPSAPVPMPTPDATPAPKTIEPAQDLPTSVPISLPARKKPAYKYPAYGDK